MEKYLPEGYQTTIGQQCCFKNMQQVNDALATGKILEARAIVCDSEHNLIVDLGFMKGIIPREECAIGISEGVTRDIAIISRVNKPVCFKITSIKSDVKFKPYAILSRKLVQLECQDEYIGKLTPGDVIKGKITHLEPFGCFVDIGCGIISLLPIDAISVSRISHPKDRFTIGQNINVVVKSIAEDGKICLSHKELLGSWEENASRFSNGETVAGIIRSVESYGVFVELAPNLAGLAELKDGVQVGQHASVYIKSLIPERMKIKLIIVDAFDAPYQNEEFEYYITSGHIERFQYSPDSSPKVIETIFE
ncbi:S1 RNA-binding domain-containing protein [Paludicola sp. MB14-C6]|uniref:S1 RNA-binding domain-containing protein n=1 Tax=Paludihabitans sp. MB14-C6 TaxID=3070656 RepID=UPI0027DBEE8D|nr:S1 RNA-binding domain-containing protein [Paludicola sp. MB14-C6]WMJ22273.1 S1 RNA-binding domain-containing protein [Paludicola sp. MB14-C6]